jgi:hypothetical protein
MNPILFLDIDGVLNSDAWMKAGHMSGDLNPATEHEFFEPRAGRLLNRVIEQTNCDIVISSAWRNTHTPARLQRILRKRGAPLARCIDRTPRWIQTAATVGLYEKRGDEIQAWLDAHPAIDGQRRAFAIVDDETEEEIGHLTPFLVQTSWKLGLQREHVDRLVQLLVPA